MDAAELERIRLAIENGIASLGDTLESVVDMVFDKIDALAEVRPCIDKIQSCFNSSLTVPPISFILMLTLPGRHSHRCTE